jgi:hypothetical protein
MGEGEDEDKKVRYKNQEYKDKYIKCKNRYNKLKQKVAQFGGNNELSNWKHKEDNGPVAYYNTLVEKYGEPYILVNKEGGMCVWKDNIGFNEKIILKDEFVKHETPRLHFDFLYSFIKVYISPDKLTDVIKISESINYDPLLKLLRARCASIEANVATFKTALDLLDDLEVDYSKNIKDRNENKQDNETYVANKIKENNIKYSNELNEPSYDLDKI